MVKSSKRARYLEQMLEAEEKKQQVKKAKVAEWTGYLQPLPDPRTLFGWEKCASLQFNIVRITKSRYGGQIDANKSLRDLLPTFMATDTYKAMELGFKPDYWTVDTGYSNNSFEYTLKTTEPPKYPDCPLDRFSVLTVYRPDRSVEEYGVWTKALRARAAGNLKEIMEKIAVENPGFKLESRRKLYFCPHSGYMGYTAERDPDRALTRLPYTSRYVSEAVAAPSDVAFGSVRY